MVLEHRHVTGASTDPVNVRDAVFPPFDRAAACERSAVARGYRPTWRLLVPGLWATERAPVGEREHGAGGALSLTRWLL